MPELPEVETVVQGLKSGLSGRKVTNVTLRRQDLRFPFPPLFAQRLAGRRIIDVTRRAKYIMIHLDKDLLWLCHLGMSGRMTMTKKAPVPILKHDHVVVAFSGGLWLCYNDARRFGLMDLFSANEASHHKLLERLGPEPLDQDFSARRLAEQLSGRKSDIKAALLDQGLVVGIGNIYASEALFRAGIAPTRIAGELTESEILRLVKSIKNVLTEAIKAGGSSLRDYVKTDGELGYFQKNWRVYGKDGQACYGCRCAWRNTGGVKRIVQAGRSSFYCPHKQR